MVGLPQGLIEGFFGRARLTKNSRQAVECADETSRPIQVFKNNCRSLDTVHFGWDTAVTLWLTGSRTTPAKVDRGSASDYSSVYA